MITPKDIAELQGAMAHQKAGRLPEAAKAYNSLLDKMPGNFGCIYSLAMIYAQQQNFTAAANMFRRAVQIKPDLIDVHYNLAVALSMAGDHKEAALSYEKVLALNPRHANARNNYATTLLQAGRPAEALRQYDELIAQTPASAETYNNRAMARQALKQAGDALSDYDRAIALRPQFAEAHVNRGNALADLRRSDEAVASYQKALALRPDFADAHNNTGNIYFHLGRYEDAVAAYDKGLTLQASDSEARSMRLSAKMHLCDWSTFEKERDDLLAAVKLGQVAYPFVMLALSSAAEDQLLCAKKFSQTRFPGAGEPLRRDRIYRHDRIRVAYLSGDFREHPVAYLVAGMFEHHDRSRFDVTAISFGPAQDGGIRLRLKDAVEHFIDVAGKSDQDVAALLRESETDIAVDLMGYTTNSRTPILANRAAPVQVNYLGYPGTMGADYIDYMIADRYVVPEAERRFYSERIVYLPDVFQANDSKRTMSEFAPSRAQVGLPENAFVFCAFNNSYKILPAVFAVWMRLLRQIPDGVLWLLAGNPNVERNLRREAENGGVDPARLIFAPRIPYADYLARYRLADLFLDTLPFNAGTTASDALWAGLPLITCPGQAFASRMAGSLLAALDMSELIAESMDGYEALALNIARDPALCAHLKEKLARHRQVAPLFDTARFTRHIEAAYATMWQAYQDGRPAENFSVPSGGANH